MESALAKRYLATSEGWGALFRSRWLCERDGWVGLRHALFCRGLAGYGCGGKGSYGLGWLFMALYGGGISGYDMVRMTGYGNGMTAYGIVMSVYS